MQCFASFNWLHEFYIFDFLVFCVLNQGHQYHFWTRKIWSIRLQCKAFRKKLELLVRSHDRCQRTFVFIKKISYGHIKIIYCSLLKVVSSRLQFPQLFRLIQLPKISTSLLNFKSVGYLSVMLYWILILHRTFLVNSIEVQ